MPKLSDIVKDGIPCTVRHKEYSGPFHWNGQILDRGVLCGTVALFSDGWELEEPAINTLNEFGVGLQGGKIVILNRIGAPLNKARALTFAAWIVAIIDANDEFPKYLEAVRNT